MKIDKYSPKRFVLLSFVVFFTGVMVHAETTVAADIEKPYRRLSRISLLHYPLQKKKGVCQVCVDEGHENFEPDMITKSSRPFPFQFLPGWATAQTIRLSGQGVFQDFDKMEYRFVLNSLRKLHDTARA